MYYCTETAKKKKTLKFHKLALIEGKILNLMFRDIYIPVRGTRWELVTSNSQSETKNSQSRFSLIIPPNFKDEIVTRLTGFA